MGSKKWPGADERDRQNGYWTWRPDSHGVMRRVRIEGSIKSGTDLVTDPIEPESKGQGRLWQD
jgi:hypothetical protein